MTAPKNMGTTISNITAAVASTKISNHVAFLSGTTATKASSTNSRRRSDEGSEDGKSKEDDSMSCEHDHHDNDDESHHELVESISAPTAAMSFDRGDDHLFAYCGFEASHLQHEQYIDMEDYDVLKATIINENDRLNKEVDELLNLDSSLRDSDIEELLAMSTQY